MLLLCWNKLVFRRFTWLMLLLSYWNINSINLDCILFFRLSIESMVSEQPSAWDDCQGSVHAIESSIQSVQPLRYSLTW